MIYPWHENTWQQLTAHWQNQPNAWLLLGKDNTGKVAFARHFAQALLCEQPNEQHQACEQCPSCHFFSQHNHPDFYELTPHQDEDDTTSARKLLQIKIDEVRDVLTQLTQSSLRGGRRIVLIHPAESMNVQAANALLKMLEEPPEAVIFLLVSNNRDRVLPTIKSRCRPLILPAPTVQQAQDYLHQQHGEDIPAHLLAFHSNAPLFDVQPEQDQLREDLLALLAKPRLLSFLDYANTFDKQKLPLAKILDWLHKWLIDLALTQQQMSPLYYPHHSQALAQLAKKFNGYVLFSLIERILTLKPYGYHSLNVKMQTESLLIDYLNLFTKKA